MKEIKEFMVKDFLFYLLCKNHRIFSDIKFWDKDGKDSEISENDFMR